MNYEYDSTKIAYCDIKDVGCILKIYHGIIKPSNANEIKTKNIIVCDGYDPKTCRGKCYLNIDKRKI
jgi:hypothetical protein